MDKTIIKINGVEVLTTNDDFILDSVTPAVDFEKLHIEDGVTTLDFVTRAGSRASKKLADEGHITLNMRTPKVIKLESQKLNLRDHFHGMYGDVLIAMDKKFDEQYKWNLIELKAENERIMTNNTKFSTELDWTKGTIIKAGELYKLMFPTPLENLEYFLIHVCASELCNITVYENSYTSILIKSDKTIISPKIEVWNHNNGGVRIHTPDGRTHGNEVKAL